ncbi:MAG: S8 family serine peptidase [Acidobacteriota bacterium]
MRSIRSNLFVLPAAMLSAVLLATLLNADVPYPTCEDVGCEDPADFGAYLLLPPGTLPDDFDPAASSSWKYLPDSGMDVVGAWQISTGRPDVVIAVLDSGIRWRERELARKVALNTGEQPFPDGCVVYDCNGDGFVSVDDYTGVPDHNGNGLLDGQDLIREFSDGADDDGNGYTDDIAGWDFYEDDNDPDDDVDFGHGTGEGEDSVAEANNGSGMPGVAPSSLFLPLRVADSFIAVGSDFAQAVVYAVDRRVSVISEALGAISASPTSQAAIDYVYHRGIPLIASAADEESRHHNLPSGLEHTIWVNSIVHGDGVLVRETDQFDLLNGCTNYGGQAWVAISSNGCSSEATGRAGGLAALLVSQGKNLMDRGLLSPYPGLETPFSAEEVRQLLRQSAQDINHEGGLGDISMLALLSSLLSAPMQGLFFESIRFATQQDWDQYTGYGRPNTVRLLQVSEETLPPEADLSGSLRWFDTIDPSNTSSLPIRGSAAAVRSGGAFDYVVEVGCGVQPKVFSTIGNGSAGGPLRQAILANWKPALTAASCGFDPGAVIQDPDAHTVTVRLRVTDSRGNVGEDRRTVAIHSDPTLHMTPIFLGTSIEGSPALADVNMDNVLDIVYGASDGSVHVVKGDSGKEVFGFPVRTDPIPVHPSAAYASGEVPVPHEAIVGPTAVGDLDGDGGMEIVVASAEGKVYVFERHGRRRRGFPVSTNPAFSDPANRDSLNDTDPGILSGPTLADLDGEGVAPDLEIVVPALDGHLYVWNADGATRNGFPVRIADLSKVQVDPITGKATPLPGVDAHERAAKLIGSVAVGDLDGDGLPEIVATSNEEYGGEPDGFALESPLLKLLKLLASLLGFDDLVFDVGGRVYALHWDGNLHDGGPFRAGWPASVPLLAPGVLPTLGTGVPGAPALADLDGLGRLSVAIFGATGPVMILDPDGQPALGEIGGVPRALAADFPDGFPEIPTTTGSPDAPFFAALGSGAFGDLDGDGLPEYVAPTGGVRKLLDVAGAAEQGFADHQVVAWNPRDGSLLPAFPRPMDDTQFLSSPALADVDGDGRAEIVQGSGAYLLRAYREDGTEPADWPKFTHGWIIGSPTPGDVDGDGLIEWVAATREGRLYVWDTAAPATEEAILWQGFGHDRRNTQNLSSGVPMTSPPLQWRSRAGWRR